MPSGLLNGRGCYDSLKKCQDEAPLYLNIRHHQTSFLLEQRKKREELEQAEFNKEKLLDGQIKEKISNGAMPGLRAVLKLFFLVTFFPFYFVFNRLPKLLGDFLLMPLINFLRQVYLKVSPPVKKLCLLVISPIGVLCSKTAQLLGILFVKLRQPIISVMRICSQVLHQIIAPLAKILSVFTFKRQQIGSRLKVAKTWLRHLSKEALSHVRSLGKGS